MTTYNLQLQAKVERSSGGQMYVATIQLHDGLYYAAPLYTGPAETNPDAAILSAVTEFGELIEKLRRGEA